MKGSYCDDPVPASFNHGGRPAVYPLPAGAVAQSESAGKGSGAGDHRWGRGRLPPPHSRPAKDLSIKADTRTERASATTSGTRSRRLALRGSWRSRRSGCPLPTLVHDHPSRVPHPARVSRSVGHPCPRNEHKTQFFHCGIDRWLEGDPAGLPCHEPITDATGGQARVPRQLCRILGDALAYADNTCPARCE